MAACRGAGCSSALDSLHLLGAGLAHLQSVACPTELVDIGSVETMLAAAIPEQKGAIVQVGRGGAAESADLPRCYAAATAAACCCCCCCRPLLLLSVALQQESHEQLAQRPISLLPI